MTEKKPSTPSFDPNRSAAIRELLLEEVRAGTPRRRPSARAMGIGSLAVITGVIVSGTAAFALSGGTIFGSVSASPQPTSAVTSTSSPAPTSTPTQLAAPQPENPSAPVIRVPLGCGELMPPSAVESIIGPAATAVDGHSNTFPTSFTDERAGGLECSWLADIVGLNLTVVPGVTAADFDEARSIALAAVVDGETTWHDAPDLGQEAVESCDLDGGVASCNVTARAGDYGVQLFAGVLTTEETAALQQAVVAVIAQLEMQPSPEPLWQPTGPTLTGANTCEEVIDDDSLAELAGGPMQLTNFDGKAAPIRISDFQVERGFGAISCNWVTADSPYAGEVRVSVLPGGASYFARGQAREAWTPAPEYPGEAYLNQDASTVTVLIDDGWVQVTAPPEALRAVTDIVLANVGAQ